MHKGNKVVFKREDANRRVKHEERIKKMKSIIDASTPSSLIYRVSNAKKVQILEDKCTEIERENRILFEKMLRIRNKTPTQRSDSIIKSLNETSRKQKLREILQSNSDLLSRIKRKESAYKAEKFNTERKYTEKILSAISEFPLLNDSKRRQSIANSFAKKTPKKSLKFDNRLIHRQGKVMNDKSYIVEVYRNLDSIRVEAFDIDAPEKIITELTLDEAKGLCGSQLDFQRLVNCLQVQEQIITIEGSRPVSALS